MNDSAKTPQRRTRTVSLVLAATLLTAIVLGGLAAIIFLSTSDSSESDSSTAEVTWEYDRDRFGRVMQVAPGTKGVALPQSAPSGSRAQHDQPEGLALQPSGSLGGSNWYSTSDGPTSVSPNGSPSGFAHTPQGAALAATWSLSLLADWNVALAALDEGFLIDETPDQSAREDMVSAIEMLDATPDATVAPFTTAAVQIIDYHPELTRVEIATGTDETGWATQIVDLRWTDTGWSPLIQGSDGTAGRQFDRLPGSFTVWEVDQ